MSLSRHDWPSFLAAVIPAALACALFSTCQAAPPPLGIGTRVSVLWAVDGDTIEVEVRKVVRVRLLDCWAPELRSGTPAEKNRGELARKFCERTAKGTQGVLFIPTDGARRIGDVWTFDRVLAYYWPDDSEKSLSEIMVESGYATKEKSK